MTIRRMKDLHIMLTELSEATGYSIDFLAERWEEVLETEGNVERAWSVLNDISVEKNW